jgi:5-methyltetrahydropteroyltriglutamate--homocysteine methyltransferase
VPKDARSSINQVSLECIHSHVPPDLMKLLVGVIDVASDVIETPEEVADTIGRALEFVPKERLFPCTNCGLAPMARDVACASRKRWQQAQSLQRSELPKRDAHQTKYGRFK